jgi:heme-degrading monooxygenase HmoA
MAVPYTLGVWQVKPGRADEFVAAWTEFAEWTSAKVEGAGRGQLLRDTVDEHRFVSFGPWESHEAIAKWRADPGWQERVARMRELLDGLEASTLELVSDTFKGV